MATGLLRYPTSSEWWRRGRLLFITVVTIVETIGLPNASLAQQRMNFGPSPYGGSPFPEFVVPDGALGGLFALSRPDGIFYDIGKVESYGGLGTPFFRFTRAHEYAHIRRRHMPGNPQQYFMYELEADCDAARLFGWNSNEIQAAVQGYQQELPPNDMPGMPGSDRRARNLLQCGRR